jgi:hypothetical protein
LDFLLYHQYPTPAATARTRKRRTQIHMLEEVAVDVPEDRVPEMGLEIVAPVKEELIFRQNKKMKKFEI